MPLSNPTGSVTVPELEGKADEDRAARDVLEEILLVLKMIEAHLQAASDEEFTEEDVAP